jgi:hypothetical protein
MAAKKTKKTKKKAKSKTRSRARSSDVQPFERRVESWDEYVSWVTRPPFTGWAFRGHANADYPLTSTLTRVLVERRIKPRLWRRQEERILRIFKRKAHHFLERTPAEDEEFEWFALMQHHGSPTRLLDFTWSPYVAAFFALEATLPSEVHGPMDAAVWAIDPNAPGFISFAKSLLGTMENKQRVLVGEPRLMNRRLTAQSGTFAVHWRLDTPVDELLRQQHARNVITKFILPRTEVRDTGLRELYRMNISYATLFPGLDGLAESMRQELEYSAEMEDTADLKLP